MSYRTRKTRLHGWGGYPVREGEILAPTSLSACVKEMENTPLIPRGMARSYGDSANAARVLQTTYLDHYIAFDTAQGILTCEAGVALADILSLIVPKGWFLPVTPGTSYVSIGGAIASDVHGKNHHVSGTFSQHVVSITILLGTGEVVTTSLIDKPDLFCATCGGMGLTGVILTATIQLMRIRSSAIVQTTLKASCLEDLYERFELNQSATYSVAWVDVMARGARFGRSILLLGEHLNDDCLNVRVGSTISVPAYTPPVLLNRHVVQLCNTLYYAKALDRAVIQVPFNKYFYPLDTLRNWNKLYGRGGFVQYQFVLPKVAGVKGMREILAKIIASGSGSFLAVLKLLGPQNMNLLSFPMQGYTLALDFKLNDATAALLVQLDAMVIAMGGRVYLAKDALMSEASFKSMYPQWRQFERVRAKYGATGKFASGQSQRLGLL